MICKTDFGSFWGLLIDLLALLADSETLPVSQHICAPARGDKNINDP